MWLWCEQRGSSDVRESAERNTGVLITTAFTSHDACHRQGSTLTLVRLSGTSNYQCRTSTLSRTLVHGTS